MTSLYYKLDVQDYIFYMTIVRNSGSDTIRMGGRKVACVDISVNKPGSLLVERGFHILDIGTIPILAWNARCSVNKDLEKGVGTVLMISVALSEAVKRYPYVKEYSFTDNSHIPCDNGKEISLMYLSLVRYNKTWYERHFNAYISDPKFRKQFNDGLTILNDTELKMPFEQFIEVTNLHKTSPEIQVLEPYYQVANSYNDFFKNILEKEGPRKQCIMVVNWIDLFFLHIFQMNPTGISWIIDAKTIKSVDLKETLLERKPSNQDGGSFTRRARYPKLARVNMNDLLEKDI